MSKKLIRVAAALSVAVGTGLVAASLASAIGAKAMPAAGIGFGISLIAMAIWKRVSRFWQSAFSDKSGDRLADVTLKRLEGSAA